MAGANFGNTLLWMLPLVAVALIIVQEMSARLGVATGKGLADLIRESLGLRATAVIIGIVLIANLANTVSEFAGVAASMEIFGVSKYIAVPLAAVGVWLLIVKGNYKVVERVFLVASAIYLAYIASGFMAKPDWGAVAKDFVTPRFSAAAGVRDHLRHRHRHHHRAVDAVLPAGFDRRQGDQTRGLRLRADRRHRRLDLRGGGGGVHHHRLLVDDLSRPEKTSRPPRTPPWPWRPWRENTPRCCSRSACSNASVFSAAILPLSTAYVVCEAFGWESGVDKSLSEAPIFFGTYTALIVLGAAIILLPIPSLVQAMMASQTLNGVVLPIILIVMLRLINDKRLMGKFVNGRFLNIVSWIVVVILIVLTVILIGLGGMDILRNWFPGLIRDNPARSSLIRRSLPGGRLLFCLLTGVQHFRTRRRPGGTGQGDLFVRKNRRN